MKILLINHYAGSPRYGMEYRPFYLASAWKNAGHEVTLVAASYSHLRIQQPVVEAQYVEESIDGIPFKWLKTPTYQGNGLGRVLNIFSFVFQLFRFHKKLSLSKPDVVIASSTYPLDFYAARYLAHKNNAKIVFEVHDIWPLTLIELGKLSRRNPFVCLLQLAEDFAYKHADHVISLLPKAVDHMENHGMRREKFKYIPNGIDVDSWAQSTDQLPSAHDEKISAACDEGHLLLGYAGGHGLANALNFFIQAAALLRQLPITFFFLGNGPEKQALQQASMEMNLKKICFLDAIAKPAVPQFLGKMDGLFLGWQRKPIYRFGISPNKIFDYMMAGKPIIHAVDAGNDIVEEAGAGISCEPENPQAIATACKQLLEMTAEQRHDMGQRGRHYVLEKHSYHILAEEFLEVIS